MLVRNSCLVTSSSVPSVRVSAMACRHVELRSTYRTVDAVSRVGHDLSGEVGVGAELAVAEQVLWRSRRRRREPRGRCPWRGSRREVLERGAPLLLDLRHHTADRVGVAGQGQTRRARPRASRPQSGSAGGVPSTTAPSSRRGGSAGRREGSARARPRSGRGSRPRPRRTSRGRRAATVIVSAQSLGRREPEHGRAVSSGSRADDVTHALLSSTALSVRPPTTVGARLPVGEARACTAAPRKSPLGAASLGSSA